MGEISYVVVLISLHGNCSLFLCLCEKGCLFTVVCSWETQLRGKLKAGLSGNYRQKSGLMTSTKTDTKAFTILENNVLCCHFTTIASVCRMLIIIPFVYVLVTVLINAIDDWIAVWIHMLWEVLRALVKHSSISVGWFSINGETQMSGVVNSMKLSTWNLVWVCALKPNECFSM
jgi:hypothetical protein